MSESAPNAAAVFISYAREDTDPARRIADALRGFGIEVWFDQDELRGGDTWDQKIRTQIRTCALFMPIISARTQQRSEGYFRREWKLAVGRTLDMAEGVPFLVPVVIDATPESGELVPEEFMRVQWTRLAGGTPTPEFVAQVRRLLEPRGKPVGAAARASVAPVAPHATDVASKKSSRGWIGASVAVAVIAVVATLIATRRPATPETKPTPGAAADPVAKSGPSSPAVPVVNEKSIAVLPFANMSEEKDSAFFADGMHEDILTNLALIAELRVVSRTSVLAYRATTKPMRQIGSELGVAYLLEGSVRRSGNKVRVTGQLINARTDEHVWARSYDRDLTDIFAIQAALAQEIAAALQAAISPEARKQIARRPTENSAAYDLFLQGRDLRHRSPTGSEIALEQIEQRFSEAVKLDPNFAAAWAELAVVHALKTFWDRDTSAARKAKGDAAIAQAIRLAPDAPDVIRLAGTHAYYAYRDYPRATAAYEKIIRLQPHDPTGYASLGLIQRRQGRWPEAAASLRRAVELDPGNVSYLRNLGSTLYYGRRWDEAIALQRRIVALLPGQLREELYLAFLESGATGSLRAADELLARLTSAQRDSAAVVYYRKNWAIARGDYAEFARLDRQQPSYTEEEAPVQSAIFSAIFHFAQGEKAAAQSRIAATHAETKTLLEREPGNLRAQLYLGAMEAILGRPAEAVRLTREVVELMPESRDALDGASSSYWLATVYALTGDQDRAFAELSRGVRKPSQFPVATIRVDPSFKSLRGDPRFEALLNDPKNNAPLF